MHTKSSIADIIARNSIIPVLNFQSAEEAVRVCTLLYDAGFHVLEITLRHACALEAISAVSAALPDASVGAGTVTRPDDLHAARSAGAVFAVSPGLTAALAEASGQTLPLLPGIATVSEAMAARDAGFYMVKCYPAALLGGPGYVNALSAVLPDMRFCPTGGITAQSASAYLALACVPAVGGSWLTPRGSDGGIDDAGVRAAIKATRAELN